MRIRSFIPQDLPGVIAIHKEVLSTGGWAENDYLRLGQEAGGLILVGETREGGSGAVVGFIAALATAGQAEILSLAVARACQRRGIGRMLLGGAWRELQKVGVRRVYLEVRASNRPAINLYSSAGFTLNSIRWNYYNDPPEAAFVMSLAIPSCLRQSDQSASAAAPAARE